MEEKDLLKEITYLSRLIGTHKHNLTSRSTRPYSHSSSCNKQYIRNVKKEIQPAVRAGSKFPSASQFRKVNVKLEGGSVRQPRCKSVVSSLEKPTRNSGIPASKLVQGISKQGSNQQTEKKYENVKSIHINPHYIPDTSQIHHIPAYVKSVHVNPKLISVDKENGSLNEIGVPINEKVVQPSISRKVNVHVNPKIIQIDKENGAVKERIVLPAIENAAKFICKKDVSHLPVLTLQPGRLKEYTYQSKTKLVKAPGNGSEVAPGSALSNKYPKARKSLCTLRGDTLLSVSRTKLVRVVRKKSCEMKLPAAHLCSSKLRKPLVSPSLSHAVKIARKVSSKYRTNTPLCSKYKVDHRIVRTPKPVKPAVTSRYQIDRRTGHSYFRVKRTCPRGVPAYSHLLFSPVRRVSYGNRVWSAPFTPTTKIKISHKRLSRIGRNCSGGRTPNSALVRIGGVLYRTSPTHLSRSKPSEKMPATAEKARLVVRKRKLNTGHIVYVRGNKFEMDPNGRTLRRVVEKSPLSPGQLNRSHSNARGRVRRVDIGGVTFVQKTPTLLIRTNTHTARNVLSVAKQKSIAVLTKKMRKNNQPCLFYRRFGKCPRRNKGLCELVHDHKYVTICKKHLQGKCDKKDCLLSHDIIPQKMPTCKFFLEGCCIRDACPYVHVKVNAKAPLCADFLKGYCPNGLVCLKRHFMVCPEYDKNRQCRKGKYCPYPHPRPPKVKPVPVGNPEDNVKGNESPKVKRYYESESFLEELKESSETLNVLSPDSYSDGCETPRKRPKMGDLPSFIALSSPGY